jgi:hypothetical protein
MMQKKVFFYCNKIVFSQSIILDFTIAGSLTPQRNKINFLY